MRTSIDANAPRGRPETIEKKKESSEAPGSREYVRRFVESINEMMDRGSLKHAGPLKNCATLPGPAAFGPSCRSSQETINLARQYTNVVYAVLRDINKGKLL